MVRGRRGPRGRAASAHSPAPAPRASAVIHDTTAATRQPDAPRRRRRSPHPTNSSRRGRPSVCRSRTPGRPGRGSRSPSERRSGSAARQRAPRSGQGALELAPGPRSARDHPRPGGGPAARPAPAAARTDGRLRLRVLPWRTRRHGARPVHHAAQRHHRPGLRRRPPLELRSVRVAGTDARLRFERLRRDAARPLGVGRQATRRERRHRRAQQRVHAPPRGGTPRSPPSAAYREQMARYSEMRLLDIWYDRTTAEDIETEMVAAKAADWRRHRPQGRPGPGWRRIFTQGPRQGPDEGDGLAHRGRRRAVAHRRRSTGRDAHRDPERRRRASTRPSATTGPPSPRTGASSSSAIGSSTSRSRSSGSAASGRAASSSCSRDATRATRCSSRPRRRRRPSSTRTWSRSQHGNHGERVVVGQRLMQATPDIFLGWTRGPGRSRLLLPPAVGHEGLGRRRDAPPARPRRSMAGCAPARSRVRTPGAGTRSRSPPISGRATPSTGRWPTSPRRTPTRTSATTQAFTAAIADGRVAAAAG